MVFDGGLKGIVGCCKILQGGRNDNPFFQSECRADEAWSRVWKDASHALEVLIDFISNAHSEDSSRFSCPSAISCSLQIADKY